VSDSLRSRLICARSMRSLQCEEANRTPTPTSLSARPRLSYGMARPRGGRARLPASERHDQHRAPDLGVQDGNLSATWRPVACVTRCLGVGVRADE
jgi:hypothetical protein